MSQRERVEPETVSVSLDRATYERARFLAARSDTSVEQLLARLVLDALRSEGTSASGVGASPAEGLTTDGLDPSEDAYWRDLHALTRDGNEHAEATPGSAAAR